MSVRIINADVMDGLTQLEDESVHCVVTSPPYWGLRDYGTARWEGGDLECDHAPEKRGGRFSSPVSSKQASNTGSGTASKRDCPCGAIRIDNQLGLEPTLGEHIEAMVRVFREVRRVLRKDGTLWLNYGDSYATSVNGRSAADTKAVGNDDRTFRDKPFSTVGGVLKPKDLCGVPWRVAFALQSEGWWLRQDIIWSKPNPMPESIKDRCTKAHEYLFLLAKSERYYFDAEAIAEPALEASLARYAYAGDDTRINKGGRYKQAFDAKDKYIGLPTVPDNPATRNKRSVWEIATQPFPEAHFATFPPALIEPCIKAGTSERGCCAKCGAPWVRVEERTANGITVTALAADRFAKAPDGSALMGDNAYDQSVSGSDRERGSFGATHGVVSKITTRWQPSCKCKAIKSPVCYLEAPTVPCTVLDPFGGSGTTGLVADRLKRNAVLIELNPEYAAMAEKRIKGDCPMFAEVSA